MSAEQLLERVPLFQGLERRHLQPVASTAHERSFTEGEVNDHQGEQGIGLYVINTGRVAVTQNRGGQESTLRTMGPGEAFGELALLTDHARTATVRALEPTTCFVITAWNFRAAMDSSPEIARHLVPRLARWLVESEDRALAALG